jgi:hypothetical protein
LNPAVNLILISLTQSHFDNGAIGAAITTVLTELFMLAVGLRLLRGSVFGGEDLVFALRCLAACLLMAAVIWPFRHVFLPFPVMLGAGAYLAAALALRVLSRADVEAVRQIVSRRSAPADLTVAGGQDR